MWKPTNGRLQLVERLLNDGTINGKTIYFHFTNEEGCRSIVANV